MYWCSFCSLSYCSLILVVFSGFAACWLRSLQFSRESLNQSPYIQKWHKRSVLPRQCSDSNRNIKIKVVVLPIRIIKSNVFRAWVLRQTEKQEQPPICCKLPRWIRMKRQYTRAMHDPDTHYFISLRWLPTISWMVEKYTFQLQKVCMDIS